MVEINRDLYLDSKTFEPKLDFGRVADAIKAYCFDALVKCSAEYSNLSTRQSTLARGA